jgi:hypothetical protein
MLDGGHIPHEEPKPVDQGNREHYFLVAASFDLLEGTPSFTMAEEGHVDMDKPVWNVDLGEWTAVTPDLQQADVALRLLLTKALKTIGGA